MGDSQIRVRKSCESLRNSPDFASSIRHVYVSAVIRPEAPPGQILDRFLRDSVFEIVLAPAIIEETLRALTYPKVRKYLRADIDAAAWFEANSMPEQAIGHAQAAGDYDRVVRLFCPA